MICIEKYLIFQIEIYLCQSIHIKRHNSELISHMWEEIKHTEPDMNLKTHANTHAAATLHCILMNTIIRIRMTHMCKQKKSIID